MLVNSRASVLVRAVKEAEPGVRELKQMLERECRWLARVEHVGGTSVEREAAADRRRALALELSQVARQVEHMNRRWRRWGPLVAASAIAFLFSGIPQRLMLGLSRS